MNCESWQAVCPDPFGINGMSPEWTLRMIILEVIIVVAVMIYTLWRDKKDEKVA